MRGALIALFICLGAETAVACTLETVRLRGDWGQARFTVEIADDPDEQARGLMFRETLPRSSGMLFVFPRPRRAAFWMRNTLIELDMLFIAPNGTVQHIHHRAQPLDETSIDGGGGVLAVLEINGGLAKQLGIEVGSEIQHLLLPNSVWPC